MGDTVLYELDGHVATITYNRPESLNAVNGEMRRDLNAAFTRFREEEDAWVGIVTGAGKAFCAGGDIKDGAGVGRRVRGHVLGEAHDQLVRERVGDLQARHRGGERLLPRLRAHAGVVVRLRHRERARRVRVSGGAPRRARRSSARSVSPSASTGSTRWSCCSPASASTPRAPRRSGSPVGWCPTTTLMAEAHRLADRLVQAAPIAAARDQGGRGAHAAPVDRRSDPLRRDDAQGGGHDRRRGRGHARQRAKAGRRSGRAAERRPTRATRCPRRDRTTSVPLGGSRTGRRSASGSTTDAHS